MRTLGQYMLGSSATFGYVAALESPRRNTGHLTLPSFFMAIGTTIRTDSDRETTEAFARARRQPIIMPRYTRVQQEVMRKRQE